jgi:hypothetical protein
MADNAVRTLAVECNGAVELCKQLRVCTGHVFGADAAAFLALCEDVVPRHRCVNHVHQQRTAHPIIRTERCAIRIPDRSRLAYLVGPGLAVHGIDVCYEQRLVVTVCAVVDVYVTRSILPRCITQALRQSVDQPRCEA